MKPYKHAVIIAGGESSRMGKDKALLPFGGYNSLAEYQHQKLQNIFQHVALSAKTDKFDFECKVITDKYEASSPLVGILSIFESLPKVDSIFVLSVDAPFVDDVIIGEIMGQIDNVADAIVAQSPSGVQPLCALYKRSILPLVEAQYKEGNHKLQALLAKANTEYVLFKDDTPFTNLNHPEEYEEALEVPLKKS